MRNFSLTTLRIAYSASNTGIMGSESTSCDSYKMCHSSNNQGKRSKNNLLKGLLNGPLRELYVLHVLRNINDFLMQDLDS